MNKLWPLYTHDYTAKNIYIKKCMNNNLLYERDRSVSVIK